MTDKNFQIPPLTVHWFHAIDSPIKDPIAIRKAKREKTLTNIKVNKTNSPKNWVPFSKRDTIALETAYQNKTTNLVSVNEDYLFEVNISKREISPIYWEGPIYQVRRATWFIQDSGTSSKWLPCEENMSTQIEQGYLNHQPYIESLLKAEQQQQQQQEQEKEKEKSPKIPQKADDVDLGEKLTIQVKENNTNDTVDLTIESNIKEEEKEVLTEPYQGQYVVYTSQTKAWLLNDTTSAKITKTFLTKLTNNQNLGGTRLIRGYLEVKKETEKKKPTTAPTENKETDDLPRLSTDSIDITTRHIKSDSESDLLQQQQEANDYENEESEQANRDINQLVFVIHGIGQQMAERLMGQNLVHDVNVVRQTLKSTWPIVASTANIAQPNGIQVLPILWRKGILFGSESMDEEKDKDIGTTSFDDGSPTLEEITLDGAPNIRNLVADVFLDIPLYMTSKYHEAMIKVVTKEINRVYNLFIERNPNFLKNNGQVSILAHSLGSLLAFDILSAQPLHPMPGTFDLKKSTSLDFPVKNFFAIGSPLGVLLLLRNEKIIPRKLLEKQKELPQDNHITFVYPAAENIYNIFHKSDPVAYRMEPLVARHYGAKLKPVPIPYIKGGLKSMLDAGFNVGNDIALKASTMFESIKTGITSTILMRGLGFSKPLDAAAASFSAANDIEIKTRTSTDKLDERGAAKLKLLNPSGRLDYYIQEGLLENTYISALSVHMSYWQDVDVAGFLIREIYNNQQESLKNKNTVFV